MRTSSRSSVLTIDIGCVSLNKINQRKNTESHLCGSSNGPDVTSEVKEKNSS